MFFGRWYNMGLLLDNEWGEICYDYDLGKVKNWIFFFFKEVEFKKIF